MAQVSDFNVANASGASVRSDINAILEAIKTCNSGGSDPSNPEQFMFYADTADNNNLKIRNAANTAFTTIGSVDEANLGLLPRAGGTMTGNILGNDGTGAASPSYSFDTDSDTGMYRAASNTIGFSTAGVERVLISNNGFELKDALAIRFQDSSGSPFVSLKSPSSLSGNVDLTLPSSIVSGGFMQTDGSGNLSFQVVAGVPSGAVFCIAVASVPSGYLECNGAAVSRTTYAALFAVIGTQYGSGNGSSTFNIPDLRGEFIRGFDNGRGVDSGRSVASSQSHQHPQHDHAVSASSSSSVSDPGHTHTANYGQGNLVSSGGAFGLRNSGTANRINSNNTGISVSTSTSISQSQRGGTSNSSETRPRNIAMMYVIKV
mgnify:CR=1 FL=1